MSFFKQQGSKKSNPPNKQNRQTKVVISEEIMQKGKDEKNNIKTPKTIQDNQFEYLSPQRAFFFKRLVSKKLTILLVENTSKVANEKEILTKIIKSLVTDGLVSVIYYGSSVNQTEIVDFFAFNNSMFWCDNNTSDMACLYDALVKLEDIVSKKYMVVEENETEKVRIDKIEVIGIGTCKDNCSITSKEKGIDCFCQILNKPNITTKYFCLTEETFMDAAEIGFRSIGAILRNY